MTIPPLLVFACIVGVLLLIGGLIHTIYRLTKRVTKLESWRGEHRLFAVRGTDIIRMRLDGSDAAVIYTDPQGDLMGDIGCFPVKDTE